MTGKLGDARIGSRGQKVGKGARPRPTQFSIPYTRSIHSQMAFSTERAVRPALSKICAQCSTVISRRTSRGIGSAVQTTRQLQQRRGKGSLHGLQTGPRAFQQLTQGSSAKRSSSGLAQPSFTASSFPSSDPSKQKQILASDDLFHSFTNSPIPEIRQRAAFIKRHAPCPHHSHSTGLAASDAESLPPQHVDFECPDCGIPVYCSKEHWADDYERHLQICDTLRQINEDDHDLRSGRAFPEFGYAGPQIEESLVNMTNWDTFLYTRNFNAINSDRSMRQATRLLTYPVTIASVLHELSPYSVQPKGRLTVEGLKSFTGRSIHCLGSLVTTKLTLVPKSAAVYSPSPQEWRQR